MPDNTNEYLRLSIQSVATTARGKAKPQKLTIERNSEMKSRNVKDIVHLKFLFCSNVFSRQEKIIPSKQR